jgi:uncharacterized protein (TIGR00297 family)
MSTELDQIVSLQQLLIGFGLAAAIGMAGRAAKTLSTSGMLAAFLVGGLVFGFGGLPWAALLLTFFISSSLLSKLFPSRKKKLAEKFSKGSQRDWGQVFANGAPAAFLALLHVLFFEGTWPWLAFAGALATVNADTWATELGVLNPTPPRLLTTGKPVPPGTSGGVSLAGTSATIAGGELIGLVGWLFTPELAALPFIGAVALAGLTGSLIDSLLGATVQAIYYDPAREKETERQVFNQDGSPADPMRGFEWMNNDMVNFISSVGGALVSVWLWNLLG